MVHFQVFQKGGVTVKGLMQSGELGAFVYSFILTWQSKEVRCMVLKVEGNFCGRPGLGVREFVCKYMQWRPDHNVGI